MAKAIAVLPVPGAPASSSARPAIFLVLIMSTTMPAAFLSLWWWGYQAHMALRPMGVVQREPPPTYLSRQLLAHKASSHGLGRSVVAQAKAFDVRVAGNALLFDTGAWRRRRRLHFFFSFSFSKNIFFSAMTSFTNMRFTDSEPIHQSLRKHGCSNRR